MAVFLVFGASGAIGRFLLPRLLDAGHDVFAVSREARTARHPGLRWVIGDLSGDTLSPSDSAAIFSLGPLDAFADWFARSRVEGHPRIVAIGSLSAKTKAASKDPREHALADRLLRAERTLAAAAEARGSVATILRASLIYGAGLDRSLTPIAEFARRWRVFPYAPGARGLRQPVHADDLAAACVALASSPSAGGTYDVGGGERLAFATMLARVRTSLPFATLALPIPFMIARAGLGLARQLPAFRAASASALQRTNEDLVVDHAAAAADFGWSPRDFRPDASTWTPPPLP
jgi:nucleoside-diphosphate-sugar epimerase